MCQRDKEHKMNLRKSVIIKTQCIILLLTAGLCEGAGIQVLKDVFAKDFLIGMAVNDNVVCGNDVNAAEIVKKYCNTITAENVMKWAIIHPEPNRFDFAAADRFVEFGQKNNMFIVGHTLVWHRQTPNWVFVDDANKPMGREAMLARLKDHIFTVMGRYKGRVKGYDVVNEALDSNGVLRKSKWVETIGEDFIEKAFEYAHEADPNAELYYNEYDTEKPGKLEGCVRIVKQLKAKGLRIDGVGLQEHADMNYPSKAELEGFFKAMQPLGVKVMITELDVSVLPWVDWFAAKIDLNDVNARKKLNPYVDGLPAEMQKKLAERYAALFRIYVEHADMVDRVTFWGVYDKTSWLNRGRVNYPLLFDRQYQPKPAFFAVLKTAWRGQRPQPKKLDTDLH
jgi:endo-1,4-beta-xylanase